ncbi:hypothetical protein [Nonomuraea recticatena]|uniref:hypothetical protein n=1 Tax=Nonomuraea recticatena TaxID=46178 RepID=UPI00360993C6
MALILASEYKLRSRGIGEAISGGVDTQILVEIGVYGLVAVYLYRRFGIRSPRRTASIALVLAWIFALYVAMSVMWTPYPQFAVVRAAQLLVTASVCQVVATRATRRTCTGSPTPSSAWSWSRWGSAWRCLCSGRRTPRTASTGCTSIP